MLQCNTVQPHIYIIELYTAGKYCEDLNLLFEAAGFHSNECYQ